MSPTIHEGEPAVELPDVRAGRLPARYGVPMQQALLDRLKPLLADGVRILDIGSGRSPTIAPEDRPAGCRYVGLDISAEELASAPPGSYDETFVHDISHSPDPRLHDFDVALSWQVLEHVDDLERALANIGLTLRPGGVLLAQTSGSWAAFALLARVVPHRVRVWAMARFLGHHEDEKFPTRYDRCTASSISAMLSGWSSVEIVAHYRGAPYFGAVAPLRRFYLLYENWTARRQRRDLATHYLVVAAR